MAKLLLDFGSKSQAWIMLGKKVVNLKNSFYKLPGGRLRPGESDTDGLKRKLLSKLSVNEHGVDDEWEIGECLGMWWSPDFKTIFFPIYTIQYNKGQVMEMRLTRQVQKY
ncbi:hypothetical protein NE237_006157 [Protea cynaroides]|uniref:Cleavage and polyadenylation specificity factor subunit 5 n=1 Tax=Protea cynaroides TaxID=273540 RepID=A0A9Q0KLT5_9MAGN|nr:hypothetical protein NE237_006157 [Protea cynaroides]